MWHIAEAKNAQSSVKLNLSSCHVWRVLTTGRIFHKEIKHLVNCRKEEIFHSWILEMDGTG